MQCDLAIDMLSHPVVLQWNPYHEYTEGCLFSLRILALPSVARLDRIPREHAYTRALVLFVFLTRPLDVVGEDPRQARARKYSDVR